MVHSYCASLSGAYTDRKVWWSYTLTNIFHIGAICVEMQRFASQAGNTWGAAGPNIPAPAPPKPSTTPVKQPQNRSETRVHCLSVAFFIVFTFSCIISLSECSCRFSKSWPLRLLGNFRRYSVCMLSKWSWPNGSVSSKCLLETSLGFGCIS